MKSTQRFFTFVTGAALAAGTFALAGCKEDPAANQTADNRSTGQQVTDAGKKASEKVGQGVDATTREATAAAEKASAALSPSGADKLTGVRSTIEGIVQNAAKRNNWEPMADFFTEVDEKRVMNGKPDTKALDDLAENFTKAYQAKYKDAFTVMDADEKFGPDFLKITATTDANAKQAVATIPASHGQPALELRFVEENGKWKLDIPDTVDAQKLHDNLTKALTDLQDLTKLPADEKEAARHASHRILAAVMDKA